MFYNSIVIIIIIILAIFLLFSYFLTEFHWNQGKVTLSIVCPCLSITLDNIREEFCVYSTEMRSSLSSARKGSHLPFLQPIFHEELWQKFILFLLFHYNTKLVPSYKKCLESVKTINRRYLWHVLCLFVHHLRIKYTYTHTRR